MLETTDICVIISCSLLVFAGCFDYALKRRKNRRRFNDDEMRKILVTGKGDVLRS